MNNATPTDVVETKATKITIVTVKVRRDVDLGYVPFMKVVAQYHGKNMPFGLRDASRATFEIHLSAELGTDMTADALAADLSEKAHAIADRELRSEYPESFKEAVKAEAPEEAFIVSSTTVERVVTGDF